MAETFDARAILPEERLASLIRADFWSEGSFEVGLQRAAKRVAEKVAAALTEAYMLGIAHGSGRKRQRGFHVDFPPPGAHP